MFQNLHFFFTLGYFPFQTEVVHEVKALFLPKLIVQRLMITSYTSQACEYFLPLYTRN